MKTKYYRVKLRLLTSSVNRNYKCEQLKKSGVKYGI